MKTEQSKKLIEQALRNLPYDLECRDARIMLTKALNEIKKVEMKAEKKSKELTPLQRWQLDTTTGNLVSPFMSEQQRVNALSQIEALIKQEQQKIGRTKSKDDMLLD